ncbi:MAG: HlyD family efflux transporter periplasmic adaptor subunit, partial [Planctomycetes bacterium]|nr:HlyD family efflux transporter periplasmic adaptor subunit [Planctomycetota bacterium]
EKVKWIALIDDKLQTAAVERDKAAVASAQAELGRVGKLLEHAIRKEKRGDDLLNVKPKPKFPYISAAELDVLKYEVLTLRAQEKVAQAAVNQAQANLKNAEDQLRYTKILPPQEIDAAKGIKGRVIDRKVDAGQTVVGAFNAVEMFTIALEMDIHVHVYAAVDEADIGEIRLASERKEGVTFTVDAHPDVLFPGKVHDIRLNSTTTQNVVTYPVIIDAPNEKQLLTPGTTANITFQLRAAKDVLRVPVAALRFTPPKEQVRPEDRYRLEALSSSRTETGAKRTADEKAKTAAAKSERHVWVQDGKLLRAVPVTLGLTEHQYAELRKGDLREGDVVVTGIEANVTPR